MSAAIAAVVGAGLGTAALASSAGLTGAAVTAAGLGGAGLVQGVLSSQTQSGALRESTQAQTQASQASIEEQRRQFDTYRQLLQPYVDAGVISLEHQQALLGNLGPDQQAQAIQGITQGPLYTGLLQQGEDAILQNASATGGLRGGNTQAALMQYRPELLNSLLTQRYSQLGGLTSMGQSAAAGVGQTGLGVASNISNLTAQIGQAQSQQALGLGAINNQGLALGGNLAGLLLQRSGGAPLSQAGSLVGQLF